MKPTNRKLRGTLLALAAALAALPTMASDDCDVPVERWQSRDAVQKMAASKGWQVQRLKIDDGCYEIRGKDAQGRTFKAKLDPETLQVVKMKGGDRDRDRDRERAGSRARDARGQPRSAAPGAAASSANPLFTPGTAPRAQID